jgi:hypothetical protein
MTYFRQPFRTPPTATLTAMGADGDQLKNLTSAYAASRGGKPSFTIEAVDGLTTLSPAVTINLTTPFEWPAGSVSGGRYENDSTLNDGQLTGVPAVVAPAVPPHYEQFGLKTTVIDEDGVLITECQNNELSASETFASGTDEGGGKSNCVSPRIKMRFGVLKLGDAYGSDLQPQYMAVTARYWKQADNAWVKNDADNCTELVTATTNASRNIAVGNFKGTVVSGDINVTAATLKLSNGEGVIRFEPAPGKVGSAQVALNLGTTASDSSCVSWGAGALAPNATAGAGLDYLKGAWCGNTYVKDPSATLHFGSPKSKFLYMRERY